MSEFDDRDSSRCEGDERLRILLVTHECSRSGAPRVALVIARSLVDEGHDVRVVSRYPGPLFEEFEAVAPSAVEPFHRIRRRLKKFRATRPLAWLGDLVVASAVLVVRRPDLVYVNSTVATSYLRPGRWLGCRVILHAHESAAVALRFLSENRATRELLGIDVVACSPSVQSDMAQMLHKEKAEIPMLPSVPDGEYVLRRAADGSDFAYANDELVIGCCGTVEPRKGADLWVRAAEQVLAKHPHERLRFVWVGEIAQPVETNPAQAIDFIGPSANPYAHMRRFDIATLPSRDDPFPLVVLESMVLGTPVIAFGVGGVPEQIGDAGIVVRPGDVDSFAKAIMRLVEDSSARDQLSIAARDRVASLYSVSAFVEALNDVLLLRTKCAP